MRLRSLGHLRITPIFALALAGVSSAAGRAHAQFPGQTLPDRTADLFRPAPTRGPELAPAPFVRPAPGTRLVYTDGAFTVTKASGWRVEFVDDAKRPHMMIGGVVADSVSPPLILNEGAFEKLWPLRVGQQVQFDTQRFPAIWRWGVEVAGTERVTTDAGTFDCYVIDATVNQLVGGRKTLTDRTLFWYAPSVNAVVRRYQRRDGELVVRERRQDLVRLERPGLPPVGVPAPVAGKTAPRPR